MVNMADEFVSPTKSGGASGPTVPQVTRHRQPEVGTRTVEKLAQIARRSRTGQGGFDAFGILCVQMRNDGGPVRLWDEAPAPEPGDVLHYDSMVRRLQQCYESPF
jgi:hypothetical protein